jgi:Flp pilus assembly protein TadG
MRIHASRERRRSGVAAVEFAIVLPFLLLLLLGLWEVGRIIYVQSNLHSAARDAARLAAQANIINLNGSPTQIKFDTGTPNIRDTVRVYLAACGITDMTGVQIQLQFVESADGTSTPPSSTTADPSSGVKNQRFRVRISVPYNNVRWTTLTLLNPETLTAEAYWQCLVDDPFTMNTTMPGWSLE